MSHFETMGAPEQKGTQDLAYGDAIFDIPKKRHGGCKAAGNADSIERYAELIPVYGSDCCDALSTTTCTLAYCKICSSVGGACREKSVCDQARGTNTCKEKYAQPLKLGAKIGIAIAVIVVLLCAVAFLYIRQRRKNAAVAAPAAQAGATPATAGAQP